MQVSDLPVVNASLNATTAMFLLVGWIFIRRNNISAHRFCMVMALVTSAVFLSCYLIYHSFHGATFFTVKGWPKILYLIILISHTILAIVILPMIFISVRKAIRGEYEKHRRIARWTWPLWMYVSVTGVLVYFMLYQWFPPTMTG